MNNNKSDKRVLLIEDDRIAQKMVQHVLKPFNCQLECVSDGRSALQAFYNNDYDIVLLDIGLPDISGIELSKIMTAFTKEKNKKTKIVALTAHDHDVLEQYQGDYKADIFFQKPLTHQMAEELLR